MQEHFFGRIVSLFCGGHAHNAAPYNPQNMEVMNERCVNWPQRRQVSGRMQREQRGLWQTRLSQLRGHTVTSAGAARVGTDKLSRVRITARHASSTYPSPSELRQTTSGCDLHLYLPLTGATGHWALRNANLKPPSHPQKKTKQKKSTEINVCICFGDGNCCSTPGNEVKCVSEILPG